MFRILADVFPPSMIDDPEALLIANVQLLERLGRAACRGSNMPPADVEDFLSEVKLKLVENDYAALRNFQERCSLATWLALIVHRTLLDYRAHLWGRFRPSAEARRLGPVAIRLESLLVRDEKRIDVAVELLRAGGDEITLADAERIAAKLPRRRPRLVPVPLDEVDAERALPPPEPARDRTTIAQTTSVAIREAVSALPANDQAILQLHFAAGMSVARISRSLGIPQQQLYRRLRSLCARLRDRLLAAGIDAARVSEILGDADADLDLGLAPPAIRPAGPSTEREGTVHD